MQRHFLILDFIDKCITKRIYKKAREQEKDFLPDNFTAHYSRSSVIYWFVIFFIFLICTFIFGYFNKKLLCLLSAISIGVFLIVLYHISYRCNIDDDGMTISKFWFLEKRIVWKEIKKVEIIEFEPYGKPLEKNAIIRNKQDKVIFTCSYDLVGFNLIVKKAKKERRKKH